MSVPPGFVDVRHAGFNWVVVRGHESAVTALSDWSRDGLAANSACRILKEEPKRFAAFVDLAGRTYFLKSQTHARRGFATFRKSAGRKEWDHTLFAQSKGLPTPAPIAFGERRRLFGTCRTILIFERVERETLTDWVEAKLKDEPARVPPVLEAVGALLRRIHDAGLLHWDFHPDNVLIRFETGPVFTLIDLKSAEISDAPRAGRLENVAKTLLLLARFGVLAPWRPADRDAFLRGYLRGKGRPDEFFAELLPFLARRGRMMTEHIRTDFEEGGPRYAPRREGPLTLYFREDSNRNIGIELLPPEWRSARRLLEAADSLEGRLAPSTRPGWSLFLRRVDPRPARPFWFHALRGAALTLPCPLPLALVEENGEARAICLAVEGDLRPATAGAAPTDPLAEALHALDYSAGAVEACHLRVRPARGGHEVPTLLLVFPEAAADRPGITAEERLAEKKRLARLLPG